MRIISECKSVAIRIAALLFAAVLSMVGFQGKAFADIPEEITVDRDHAETLSDLITNHLNGFTICRTTEGQIIYSADVTAKSTPNGTVLKLLEVSDPGLQYIMTNGYPYVNITGTSEIDKYIMQAVVWMYVDEEHASDEFKDAVENDRYRLIDRRISPMLSEARAKAEEYDSIESMLEDQTIELPSSDSRYLSMSDDGMYLESPPMLPRLTKAHSYSVGFSEAPEGAEIVDSRGVARYLYDSGEEFRIRVPASESEDGDLIEVSVACEAELPYASLYGDPDDPNAERFVCLNEVSGQVVDKEMLFLIQKPSVGLAPSNKLVLAFAVFAFAGFVAAYCIKFKRRKRLASEERASEE